jgi:hypothetical protein
MIDDYAIADPTEETLDLSGDTDLNSSEDDGSASAVFCAPVLDRIRTSD